jgi:hypothetical protein
MCALIMPGRTDSRTSRGRRNVLRKVVLFYCILGIVVLEVSVVAGSVVLAIWAWQAIESTIRRLPSTTYLASIIGFWGFLFQIALLIGIIALGVVVPIAFWRNIMRPQKRTLPEKPEEPHLPNGGAGPGSETPGQP